MIQLLKMKIKMGWVMKKIQVIILARWWNVWLQGPALSDQWQKGLHVSWLIENLLIWTTIRSEFIRLPKLIQGQKWNSMKTYIISPWSLNFLRHAILYIRRQDSKFKKCGTLASSSLDFWTTNQPDWWWGSITIPYWAFWH